MEYHLYFCSFKKVIIVYINTSSSKSFIDMKHPYCLLMSCSIPTLSAGILRQNILMMGK